MYNDGNNMEKKFEIIINCGGNEEKMYILENILFFFLFLSFWVKIEFMWCTNIFD